MNGIFKNTLAIAGLLSIMTFSAANADDRLIMDQDVTLNAGLSGISSVNVGNGGAILNNGYNLSILGGNFNNNILESANQAVFGGAIYQVGGTLNISNGVVFDGNKVQSISQRYDGWDGQDGPSGGAIYINAVKATIGDVTFRNNKALNLVAGDETNGGAMFIQGAPTVSMGNVVFSSNSSATRGGAIYNGDSLIDIAKGEFTGNTSGLGGAVYMYDTTGKTVLNTGNGSKFDSNRATNSHGGAVANYNGVVNVEANNTFSNNTAAGNGGAIYNATYYSQTPAKTNIAGGTSFTGNTAQRGGAVYNSGLLNLDSTAGDITFSGNTAQMGSSVYLDGTAAKLTIKGDSNSVVFADNGAIAGNGNIEKNGAGKVVFSGNSKVSDFTGKYTQNAGTLELTNSSVMFDNYEIKAGQFNVLDGSSATVNATNKIIANGVDITIGSSTANKSTFNIDGVTIGDKNVVNLLSGGQANVTSKGTLIFNSDDTWEGDVNNSGSVILDGFTHSTANGGGNYVQNSGSLELNNGSYLTLGNAESEISGGSVSVGSGSSLNLNGGSISGSTDTTILNGGTLTVDGGTLNSTGKTDIQTGSSLVLNNSGSATLHKGDNWNGSITNNGSTLNLDNFTHNTTDGSYTQTNGFLNLDNDSSLILGNNGSITDGVVNVNDSSFVIDNGGSVTGGTINVGDGSSFEMKEGGVMSGGKVEFSDNSSINVNGTVVADAIFDVTNSTVVIGNTGNVTLNSDNVTGDLWTDGAVNLKGGTLNFEGTKNGSNGTFTGESGNLIIASGNQHFVIADGSSIIQAVNTNINSGSALDVSGGNVELGSGTTWNGDVNVNSGELLLNNASKNTAGKLVQTGGNTTVTGNFAMNNSDDSISGGNFNINGTVNQSAGTISSDAVVNIAQSGTLNITGGQTTLTGTGDAADTWKGTIGLNQNGVLNLNEITSNGKLQAQGGTLNITGSELAIQDGSFIAKEADVAFSADSILNIGNDGSVAFDKDSEWAGTVNLVGGLLDYSAQSNSILHADSGSFKTSANSILNINGGSYIENAVNTNIQGVLNISGTSADDTGRVSLNDGDTLLGNTNINDFGVLNIGDNVNMADSGQAITFNGADSTMNLVGNNNLNLKAEIVGENGQINKEGSGDVIFSGGTSNFTGNLLVDNSGNLTFVDADGFGGNLQFGNIDGKKIGIFADKIQGAINQDKNAEITYSTYRDIDLFFNDKVQVSNGKLIALSHEGNDIIFNEVVDVTNGASFLAQSGRDIEVNTNITAAGSADGQRAYVGLIGNNIATKDINADNTLVFANAKKTVFENLYLTNSTLQMAQNGFRADNLNLAGNSDVLLMNGTINDTNADYVTLADGATGNFSVDISPRDWTSDRILAGSITANGKGTLNISDFQFINKCPIDRNVPLTIFNTSNPGYENIMFTATNKEIFTPIGYYGLFPTAAGNGTYTASLTRYNPQVFRGQVATIASWQNQLVVSNILFDHVQEINMQYLTQSNPNKYAAIYPQFAPYQYNKKDGSLWVKPFGVVERLGMTQGLNVNNTFWGALIGADFPALEMKKGWTMLPTTYIGYTGGHQSFSGVGMTQNGLQAGAMATFMKDQFIGSVLAYGGGYFNNMDVAGYTDNTGNWFAGAAAKAAYNYRPGKSKHFIIQPTFLASYNYYGQQNWHTNFGDMSMRADMMHGVNVAPGVNFIYGRETWSVYATIQYFYNILGFAGGRAGNDVWLPHVRMRHGFLQYGIGATKTWKDRFSAYFQFIIRNGGRTGVGFQGGLNYKL